MKYLFLVAILVSVLGIQAQNLGKSTHSFKQTTEKETDSAEVWVYNSRSVGLSISGVLLPSIFKSTPFNVRYGMSTIKPNDSIKVVVYFEPSHNINHSSAPIIVFSNGESQALTVSGRGTYSNTYYSSTHNLSEEDLKEELHQVISANYRQYSYNGARDEMYRSIDNSAGKVTCVYTARQANFTTRSGANSNSFNCEHTWPQSLFSSNLPMRSDIHHLFPTDANSNSQRGNLAFGEVSGSGSWSQGGSKKGSSAFEPRDDHKGDCARAMMYFVLRYEDYNGFFKGQETVLREWHNTYQPASNAQKRNEGIFQLQKNRNPFVDYPQFADRITKLSGNSSDAFNDALAFDDSDIDFGVTTKGNDDLVVYKSVSNFGNQTITLSNFSFSFGAHAVKNLPANEEITLKPGEGVVLEILVDQTDKDVNTQLSFTTNSRSLKKAEFTISGKLQTNVGSSFHRANNVLRVFPNPNSGTFVLSADLPLDQVEVYDELGRLVRTEVMANQYQIQNTSGGIYHIVVRSENQIFRQKMVVW